MQIRATDWTLVCRTLIICVLIFGASAYKIEDDDQGDLAMQVDGPDAAQVASNNGDAIDLGNSSGYCDTVKRAYKEFCAIKELNEDDFLVDCLSLKALRTSKKLDDNPSFRISVEIERKNDQTRKIFYCEVAMSEQEKRYSHIGGGLQNLMLIAPISGSTETQPHLFNAKEICQQNTESIEFIDIMHKTSPSFRLGKCRQTFCDP
eukprot:TRINITY_DN673_c0_g1_i6.p1 TRINITY_DN673_c0_g1~~TRINITY_DN673_c0_g1_i6.p1  ORF type:complete len:205 (+),score=19.39 TRINITY_DN673_c0_g1_i6:39-653(+)